MSHFQKNFSERIFELYFVHPCIHEVRICSHYIINDNWYQYTSVFLSLWLLIMIYGIHNNILYHISIRFKVTVLNLINNCANYELFNAWKITISYAYPLSWEWYFLWNFKILQLEPVNVLGPPHFPLINISKEQGVAHSWLACKFNASLR